MRCVLYPFTTGERTKLSVIDPGSRFVLPFYSLKYEQGIMERAGLILQHGLRRSSYRRRRTAYSHFLNKSPHEEAERRGYLPRANRVQGIFISEGTVIDSRLERLMDGRQRYAAVVIDTPRLHHIAVLWSDFEKKTLDYYDSYLLEVPLPLIAALPDWTIVGMDSQHSIQQRTGDGLCLWWSLLYLVHRYQGLSHWAACEHATLTNLFGLMVRLSLPRLLQ